MWSTPRNHVESFIIGTGLRWTSNYSNIQLKWAYGQKVPCQVQEYKSRKPSLVHGHPYWSLNGNGGYASVNYRQLCPAVALAPSGIPAFQRAMDSFLDTTLKEGFEEFRNTFRDSEPLKFSLLTNVYKLYQESGKVSNLNSSPRARSLTNHK